MTKFLCVILASLLLAGVVSAETSIEIPDVTVIENEYLSVPVYLSSEEGTIGGEVVVWYDTSMFKVREVVIGDFTQSFRATWYSNAIGVFALSDCVAGDDLTFAVIQFEAIGEPGDSSWLSFDRVILADCESGYLDADEIPGSITIMPEYEQMLGDVNCDWQVTSLDGLLTMRHVIYGLDLCSEHNADVNFDGEVTMTDARLILEMAARG